MAKTDQEILMQNGYDPAKFKLTRLPDGSGKVDPIDSGFSFSGAARDPVSDRQLSQSTAAAMDPRMTPSGLSAQQSHSQYSTERAFGTGVAHGALPAAAGFAGGLLAEAGLSAAGVAGWPLAAGVGVAGLGASVLAGMGQQALRTPEEQLKLDEMIAQHPRAYQFGNLAPNLVFGLPGIAGLQGTARFAGNTAALGMRNATRLAAETGDAAHVVNTALGAGMVAGTRGPEIVRNYAEGKPVDWEGAAIDAAAAFGLNRNNPWTGKAVNRIAGREILPETMQPFNKQKSEALREGPGKQSFPSREEQLKVQEEQAFATRFQKAQQEAHELAAEEARRAREAQLTALEQANEAKRKALEQTPEQAALQEELDKANAGLTTPKPKVTTAEALGKATPDAPVPDAPQTVDAQVAAALDPKSTRKVVLFTEGQDAPEAIEGLLPVVLTNGKTAFFNPRKWKSAAQARKAVLAADKEQFDATLLGMSQSVKPANAAAVVTTDAPNGTPNVQAEVVGLEGMQAAAAAGQAAVPGGTTKVKPAGAVEGERLSSETPESFNTEAGAVPQGQQATYRLASALGASGVDTRVVGSPVPLHDPSNPDTSYHGKFRPGAKVETPDGVVEVPPAVTATTQRADTLAHEATHVAWDRFDAKQRAKFEAGLKDDPEYLAAVAAEPDLTPQEFVARHGGVELLRRIAAKDWGFWKDVGATWRVFRGQGDKADVLRQLGNMLAASPDRKGGGVTYRALTDDEVASGMRKPEPVGPAPTYVPNFQAKFGEPADTKVRSEEEANLPRKPVALLSERVAELRAEFPNHEDTVWTEAKARWRLNGLKQTEPKLRQYIDQLRGEGLSDLEVNQQLQHDALGGYADQPQYSRGTMDTPSTEDPFKDRTFATQTEKELRSGAPFGVQLDKAGNVPSSVLVGRIAKLPKVEQELLKPFVQWANEKGTVNAKEAAAWLRDNGPRAEVKNYGMDREQSAAKRELDALTHDWLETRDGGTQEAIRRAVRSQERQNNRGVEAELATLRTPNDIEQARRYLQLTTQVIYDPDVGGPTATTYYNSISPRPVDRPMPEWTATKGKRNLQRVDVVIPSEHPQSGVPDDARIQWKQDNLHENLPNTLGWAAIQYETGPNGERIAHVIEAQSRWGQEMREKRKIAERYQPGDFRLERLQATDHPLLADYNRLILKAAIDQARKEGATHIAVSDAETAMLTEMHDQSAAQRTTLSNYDSIAAKIQDAWNQQTGLTDFKIIPNPAEYRGTEDFFITRNGVELGTLIRGTGDTYAMSGLRSALEQALHERHPRGYSDLIDSPEPFQLQRNRVINQEGGMRFNYDAKKGQLHRIASELTGYPGEDISFGEHKNASEGYSENGFDITGRRHREDLILKNPDGTPKTTATGRLYPIDVPAVRRATGEPYSFGGTKYSKGAGFSTIDRISDPEVEFAFRRAFNDRSFYEGKWARDITEQLTPDERAIIDDVRAKRVQWYRKTGAPAFTPEEKALSDKLDAHYTGIANEVNTQGGPRVIKPRPYYEPENISTVAKHWLTTKGSSVESHAIEKAIADHWVDPKIVASKGLLEAQQEAAAQARSYVDGLRGSEPDQDLSTHFGPLRKEAGFGLPASVTVNGEVIPIREADAVRALTTYGRRTARDFAFYKNVEEPYGVGLNGQQTPIPNVPNIKEDPFVVHAMTAYRGRDVGGENPFNQRVHQAMRMASSMKLAAVAGVRNVLQLPTEMFKYAGNDVSVPLRAFNEARSNYNDVLERAIARGGFRRSQSDLAYADNTYSTDRVAELFGQAADAIGKWGGRGKLEEASRVLSTAQAEIRAAKMLADNDVEGMRRLGVDPTAPHAGEKLTLALTSAIEGTYDARELPTYIWSGNKTFEDLFSVFKWNIEKSNTFYKDVLKPAANGNPGPLIMSLAAAAGITVPLTKFLNEFVNKRKAGPTWREISTADEMTGESHLRQRAAWLTDAVNLAGVAGMYSTLANQAAQLLAGNAAHNLVFVAGNEVFLKDLVNAGVSYIETLNAGEDPIDAAGVLTKQMLSNMFQTGRALMNQLPAMKDELQRKSDLRDRSVYEQLVNDKQGQRNPATPNPAIGMKEKEFKQTADMVQATELLDILVKRYVDKYKTRPDLLKDKLESLARNPDRLFPSLDGNDDLGAVRYASYLRSVFGDEELKRRASEAAMRQALNSAKSDMARQFVPDL